MQPLDEPFDPKEDRPKYKLSKMLRLLSIDMRMAAVYMAGSKDNEWLKHAYELVGAADMVTEWAGIAKQEEKGKP